MERVGKHKSDASKTSSPRAVTFGTVEEERAQVAKIISMVNAKSAEIKGKLTKKPEVDQKEEEELEISIEEDTDDKPADKEHLAEALAEQILADLLEKETTLQHFTKLLKRTRDFRPEVMPAVEFQLNLDKSISTEDQIIAGVDTSIEAVE